MPILNKQLPPEQDKRENIIDVPVDVDTAAGRLKRYYKFYSNDEVNAIRNNGTTDGKWQASAIIDNGHIWDAMPGSYYKMGGNWRKGSFDDHLTIEVERTVREAGSISPMLQLLRRICRQVLLSLCLSE